MKQIIENTLAKDSAIHNAYNKARDAQDKAGQDAARAAHYELRAEIEANGRNFANLIDLLIEARENGNELIDVHDPHDYYGPAALIATLREYGIERFAFSASSTATAMEFVKAGCEIRGMAEINTRFTKIGTDERETRPAFIFEVR